MGLRAKGRLGCVSERAGCFAAARPFCVFGVMNGRLDIQSRQERVIPLLVGGFLLP